MIKATLIDHMGNDLTVVNAARVSFGKKREALGFVGIDGVMQPVLHDTDTKLINYLAKHKHMSPFGHCFVSFHVKAPVFVARQLVKHKFLRWNEISRRYVDDEPEFYEPQVWRGRSKDKKQGSSNDKITHTGTLTVPIRIGAHHGRCVELYRDMIFAGIAPEQARMVLPQSTMTEWYWSGSMDAFSDMCNLRCKSDTQAETREVADQIYEQIEKIFPISWSALAWADLEGLTSTEIRAMTDAEKQRSKEKSIANGRR
jgi:thymidylate synthase (FAD)